MADAVVAQLLRVHLGMLGDEFVDGTGPAANVRSFRDLYQLPFLCSPHAKRELLRSAEATGCAGVLLDVLLFLSHTMAPAAFARELAAAPAALAQWVHYISEQCVVDNERVSLDALRGVLELYSSTQRFHDLATLLLSLVAKERQRADAALRVAREVAAIMRHFRHRFPSWVLDLVSEHIALLELQFAVEQRDAATAPEVCNKSGYMDKRARGAAHLQANWRMRYFQLDATELSYSKHDAEKLAHSRNPFLDKRQKGSVRLARGLSVKAREYNGKLSRRPHCIEIGEGDRALLVDACTPVVQFEWMAALAANVRRLELDPVWIKFPRRPVPGATMAEFLRYCLLYHSRSDGGEGDSSDPAAACRPHALRERFHVDDRRFYYAQLQHFARAGDWHAFEAHTRPSKPTMSLLSPAVGSGGAGARGGHGAAQQQHVDPTSIGYGAILDLAVLGNAPGNLVADCDALFQKQEAKSSSSAARTAWSCRSRGDESASLSIRISAAHTDAAGVDYR
ncbi:hypothetical protein PybrP1_002011 [[Pythium] brassicae (nom. inval.)]|nr:hypothetical protein PybrP1_002011 [[Pythium] brassicae (nom. inval.)]